MAGITYSYCVWGLLRSVTSSPHKELFVVVCFGCSENVFRIAFLLSRSGLFNKTMTINKKIL
jgi:hypothetical protein